ncbi:glycoside hydrolase family 43 protein [Podospora didyma]|uniref:Glycoside hydrolase family 43 protein n=1 Tax=Podospora didyma TaxID=330526 RepID=A0AAE0NHG0_9PEZI|nr:glycoside hydrolase family 43 protein [Podospora didyma]
METSTRANPLLLSILAGFLLVSSCLALSIEKPRAAAAAGLSLDLSEYGDQVTRRAADPDLAGYLGVFFLGADPYVYFYLSNGNNPTSFKALNKGSPVMKPTKGTGGVRDPSIIRGGGDDASKKWYIIGTDLNIGKTTWDASQRTGSKGIFVWESTDLVNWVNERLVTVEDSTAGMVWAPEAIWDPAKKQYLVHWASKFYPTSDARHTGNPSNIRIRYAYTSDFKTFSTPQTLIDKSPTNIIDLDILPLNGTNGQSFLRFMKDETKKTVFVEVSTTGLFGTWTRPGGDSATIQSGVEGPAAYLDNLNPGKVHLLLDFYGGDGYRPYESTNPQSNSGWTASSRSGFPANLRHGSVLPISQGLYDALNKKWG